MKFSAQTAARAVAFPAVLLLLSAVPLLDAGGEKSPFWQLVREGIPLAVFGLLTLFLIRLDETPLPLAALTGKRPLEGLLLGGGIGVLLSGGVLAIFKLRELTGFRSQLHSLDGMWIWLLALLFRTVWSSLFCCGYLPALLERLFGKTAAVSGTALLYLLLCAGYWGMSPAACPNILAMGLMLGLLRLLTGGGTAPAAACFIWNFTAGFLFNGLPLEGYPSLTTLAFDRQSGFYDSPAALGAALFCAALLLAAYGWSIRKKKRAAGRQTP